MFRPTSALTFDTATTVLEAGLRAIASGQTEIDLSQLTTVDSSAVSVLLVWQRAAHANNALLHLQGIPANLQSLMDLYGLKDLLPH